MSTAAAYRPGAIFSVEDGPARSVPRVFISPGRYIQGDGVLDHIGRYLTAVPSSNPAILISARGRDRVGQRLEQNMKDVGFTCTFVDFRGECSMEEIERVVGALSEVQPAPDAIVAVGGGKCVDAGKSIAYRLDVPAVVCPSLASNDAPCSALSVLYTPQGVSVGAEFFPSSPAIVAVDTRIVAEAPARYLVAGMGDAMATWYEARTCYGNPKARSTVGARPTLTARAIGELCAETLFEVGEAGLDAVNRSEVNEALEGVVEANTLLSGLGFESGGLAGAHSVAQAFTVVPRIQQNFLHGEMVAMGLLTQLVLEDDAQEAERVARFFAKVGLPVHFGQLSLSVTDDAEHMRKVMKAATEVPIMANEPFNVTVESLLEAASIVQELGSEVEASEGRRAYDTLHG